MAGEKHASNSQQDVSTDFFLVSLAPVKQVTTQPNMFEMSRAFNLNDEPCFSKPRGCSGNLQVSSRSLLHPVLFYYNKAVHGNRCGPQRCPSLLLTLQPVPSYLNMESFGFIHEILTCSDRITASILKKTPLFLCVCVRCMSF